MNSASLKLDNERGLDLDEAHDCEFFKLWSMKLSVDAFGDIKFWLLVDDDE